MHYLVTDNLPDGSIATLYAGPDRDEAEAARERASYHGEINVIAPVPDTCIHREKGLCPDCQESADEDPEAWTEYGNHTEGIQRWKELQAEMAAEAEERRKRQSVPDDPDIPF